MIFSESHAAGLRGFATYRPCAARLLRYCESARINGALETGKLADLAVLSADYMTVAEDQIKDIKVDMTVVGGKVVFQR